MVILHLINISPESRAHPRATLVHSRAASSVEAHHRVNYTGINSGGRRKIKKKALHHKLSPSLLSKEKIFDIVVINFLNEFCN